MEIFQIVVGVFSIIGALAAIFSASLLIKINNYTSIEGDGKLIQKNKGRYNKNQSKVIYNKVGRSK